MSNGFRGGETARVVLFQKSGQERPNQLCENFHNLSIVRVTTLFAVVYVSSRTCRSGAICDRDRGPARNGVIRHP